MAKRSELVLSSLRNMILTKNKIKEEGMKCAVNSAKQTNKNKKKKKKKKNKKEEEEKKEVTKEEEEEEEEEEKKEEEKEKEEVKARVKNGLENASFELFQQN